MHPTLDDLHEALALADFDPVSARQRMAPAPRGKRDAHPDPDGVRTAHALAYVHGADAGLHLPLTLRPAALREHAGQVSFPGGRPEGKETGFETARREAYEEIGLPMGGIEALGVLDPIYIPVTHTELIVHVATGAHRGPWQPSPDEVADVRDVPLAWLLDPARRKVRFEERDGRERRIPWFDLPPFHVWGATAVALADLAGRLEAVMGRGA